METDIAITEREVYNVLDLIGDIGGLIDGIGYISAAIIFLIKLFISNPMMVYLMHQVFTIDSGDDQNKSPKKHGVNYLTMIRKKRNLLKRT